MGGGVGKGVGRRVYTSSGFSSASVGCSFFSSVGLVSSFCSSKTLPLCRLRRAVIGDERMTSPIVAEARESFMVILQISVRAGC